MKFILTTFFFMLSFYGFSQLKVQSDSLGYKGPVKLIYTYTYSDDKSDTLANQKSLHPRCEACSHYKKFNQKGQLTKNQNYVILEPVNDLEMGFCHNQVYEYEDGELINITSKIFENHGLDIWEDKLEKDMNGSTYSIIQKEDTTITSYREMWGDVIKKYFYKGLLVKDPNKIYTYDDKGRLVKSFSFKKNSQESTITETWIYNNILLLNHTSIQSGSYFFGSQTKYAYYKSGKLFSEKEYKLADPKKENKTAKLTSAHFFYEDGRDSSETSDQLYSSSVKKNSFSYKYEFHSNGTIATKSKKTSFGEIADYESYDDRGNLTQSNSYNINFELYKIKKFIYNKKNQLIELSVNNYYDDVQYSYIYGYDDYGNKTHTYRKSDETTILLEENVFEYYR